MMTLYVALFWKRGGGRYDFPVGINQWLIVVCVRLTAVFCVGLAQNSAVWVTNDCSSYKCRPSELCL